MKKWGPNVILVLGTGLALDKGLSMVSCPGLSLGLGGHGICLIQIHTLKIFTKFVIGETSMFSKFRKGTGLTKVHT